MRAGGQGLQVVLHRHGGGSALGNASPGITAVKSNNPHCPSCKEQFTAWLEAEGRSFLHLKIKVSCCLPLGTCRSGLGRPLKRETLSLTIKNYKRSAGQRGNTRNTTMAVLKPNEKWNKLRQELNKKYWTSPPRKTTGRGGGELPAGSAAVLIRAEK